MYEFLQNLTNFQTSLRIFTKVYEFYGFSQKFAIFYKSLRIFIRKIRSCTKVLKNLTKVYESVQKFTNLNLRIFTQV